MTLAEKFIRAEEMMKKPSFRKNRGLGNEVGYYVFDYKPEEELEVRRRVEEMRKKSELNGDEYKIVVYDLYDIIIDILLSKGYLEKCYDFERKKGFDRITTSVGKLLRISLKDNLIVNYIKENTPEKAIIFILGIGKCYPILRSHSTLNQLHEVIDNVPVVMFFPGEYDGQELILFSEVKDDNYYRAFKLTE